MTAKVATQVRSFPNNAALAQGTLVKMSGGFLAAAGATDRAIGVMENRSFAADPVGSVRMFTDSAYHVAGGAVTAYAEVFQAASGKLTTTAAGVPYGMALGAASGDGSSFEVLPYRQSVLSIVGIGGGYKLARGSAAALDGSNPTPIATGLATIVSASAQLRGTAAPGDNTSVLTTDYTGSDGTLNVYAWKNTGGTDPTLVASTGTETFDWIAIGT